MREISLTIIIISRAFIVFILNLKKVNDYEGIYLLQCFVRKDIVLRFVSRILTVIGRISLKFYFLYCPRVHEDVILSACVLAEALCGVDDN